MIQGTTTWGTIKQFITAIEPAALSGYVESSSGSPTELAIYARMVNNEISGNAYKHSFRLRSYQLTLTGASTYDLNTLIPDLDTPLQIVSDELPNKEGLYLSPGEFNIETGGIWFTIKNGVLVFKNPPLTGTLEIPYYTKYLVRSAAGTYKLDFTDSTDYSIIPDNHIQVLLEGILEWVARKSKKPAYVRTYQLFNGQLAKITPGMYHVQQLILDDKPLSTVVRDFRYRIY